MAIHRESTMICDKNGGQRSVPHIHVWCGGLLRESSEAVGQMAFRMVVL